jgi:hypothetical protein
MNTTTPREMPARGVTSSLNAAVALKQLSTPVAMSTPINPNKALWEKGDFTRIAKSMRESGEALVTRLGITKGLKPIFYSFEAVLIRFTLLEFAKIEKCSATFAV